MVRAVQEAWQGNPGTGCGSATFAPSSTRQAMAAATPAATHGLDHEVECFIFSYSFNFHDDNQSIDQSMDLPHRAETASKDW